VSPHLSDSGGNQVGQEGESKREAMPRTMAQREFRRPSEKYSGLYIKPKVEFGCDFAGVAVPAATEG